MRTCVCACVRACVLCVVYTRAHFRVPTRQGAYVCELVRMCVRASCAPSVHRVCCERRVRAPTSASASGACVRAGVCVCPVRVSK